MLDFQNPFAFLLLLLLPLYFVLKISGFFRRISFPLTFADWNGKPFDWNAKVRSFFSGFSVLLTACAFICVVIALADPVVSHSQRVYVSRGTDVMFVLDVSPSMAARDMGGMTRLEAAKNSIRAIVAEENGSEFGIVALASEAAVVVPPTTDRNSFMETLASLTVGMLGDGSALGTGISTAVYHLVASRAPVKCIVLITDGENNAGAVNPETAAELSKRNNIVLNVLAIGTKGTVQLEYTDLKTGQLYSGYLESNYDVSSLKKIADIGGGNVFEIQSLSALSTALENINRRVATAQVFYNKTTSEQFYSVFVLAAIIFVSAAWFLRRVLLKEVV